MAAPVDTLRKLQDYARKAKDVENSTPSSGDSPDFAARLDVAYQELLSQVKEEQKALEQVMNNILASCHSRLTFP